MALDWKDQKDFEVPKEILERISRNLFDFRPLDSTARHPSEDLVSALFGAMSGLKLDLPGSGSVEFDPKRVQRQYDKGKKTSG